MGRGQKEKSNRQVTMIRAISKIMGNEKLNGGDILHIVEFVLVGGMVLYGVYTNSKEVPGLKDALNNTQTRVAVLESGQTDLKNALGDIRDSLGRIEDALLINNGSGHH